MYSHKNILIACEESQTICKRLREKGFNAFSCDIKPATGGHPEWHIQGDAIAEAYSGKYHMMIAHPPCTYLTVSGNRWYYHPDDKDLPTSERRPHPKFPNRAQDREDAVDLFKKLLDAPIDHIAIENPIGIISSRIRKPDQIVQPYHFGDEATKTTCLWLKGLPALEHTNVVGKGERTVFASGKSHPKWYADALAKAKTKEELSTIRSKTFPGMADAMVEQWLDYVYVF
jgi:hypothetical protein